VRLTEAVPIFAALGDPVRLAIVARLCGDGPLPTLALKEQTGVSRQGVSKHLRLLEQSGLIRSGRKGRDRLWRIDSRRIAEAHTYLAFMSAQWDARLERLRLSVEGSNKRIRKRESCRTGGQRAGCWGSKRLLHHGAGGGPAWPVSALSWVVVSRLTGQAATTGRGVKRAVGADKGDKRGICLGQQKSPTFRPALTAPTSGRQNSLSVNDRECRLDVSHATKQMATYRAVGLGCRRVSISRQVIMPCAACHRRGFRVRLVFNLSV
jgi:DNA-binding transcriptional ArsR family regulator